MSGHHLDSFDLQQTEARMFRDIPSPAEAELFNEIFRDKIIETGITGVTVDGEPNDLAMAFEKVYVKEYEENNRISEESLPFINDLVRGAYDPEEGGLSELSEQNVTEHADFLRDILSDALKHAICSYLEEHDGRIGRFPYAYSRKAACFSHPLRDELLVRHIDPLDLRWKAGEIDRIAEQVDELELPQKFPYRDRARKHTIRAAFSAFILILLGVIENLFPNLLPSEPYLIAVEFCFIFAFVSFILALRNRKYAKTSATGFDSAIRRVKSESKALMSDFSQLLFELRFFELWLSRAPKDFAGKYAAGVKELSAERSRLEKTIAKYNQFVLAFNSAMSNSK